jgi:hypothetical protein
MAMSFQRKILVDGDLLRDQDRTQWQNVTVAILTRLWQSSTGHAVISEILASDKIVKIVPWYASDKDATSDPRDLKAAYYPGRPVRGGDGIPIPSKGLGTGTGSDVRLAYTPWRWAPFHRPIILLHEMVHASEEQRGVIFCNAMKNSGFDSVAEFEAIVVENICRSEFGVFIRENHHGFEPIQGDLMVGSWKEMKVRLDSFRARMPHLTQVLSRIDVPFNPLRPGALGAPK